MGDTTTGRPLSVLSSTILKMNKLLALLLLSTTIHANPYSNDKIQSDVMKYIATVAPTLYMLNACESEIYIPTLNYSIEQTY